MIFGTSIPKETGHQMLFNFSPHPTSASTLPGENRTNEIWTKLKWTTNVNNLEN